MDIPYSRWFSVIEKRRSRRSFKPTQLDKDILTHLDSTCKGFRPFPDARAVLVREVPDALFKGSIGPYGKVKGAPAFIAFIGNMDSSNAWERVVPLLG